MKKLLLALLLICPLLMMGQSSTVNGQVSSEDSGDPVAGAMISLKKDGAVVTQLYTNHKGDYTIPSIKQGVYTIEITKSGYATIIITEVDLMAPQHIQINPAFEYGSYDTDEVLEISYKELQREATFGIAK